jgi:hypothetical protein
MDVQTIGSLIVEVWVAELEKESILSTRAGLKACGAKMLSIRQNA